MWLGGNIKEEKNGGRGSRGGRGATRGTGPEGGALTMAHRPTRLVGELAQKYRRPDRSRDPRAPRTRGHVRAAARAWRPQSRATRCGSAADRVACRDHRAHDARYGSSRRRVERGPQRPWPRTDAARHRPGFSRVEPSSRSTRPRWASRSPTRCSALEDVARASEVVPVEVADGELGSPIGCRTIDSVIAGVRQRNGLSDFRAGIPSHSPPGTESAAPTPTRPYIVAGLVPFLLTQRASVRRGCEPGRAWRTREWPPPRSWCVKGTGNPRCRCRHGARPWRAHGPALGRVCPARPRRVGAVSVVRDHYETFRVEAAWLRDGEGLPRFVEEEFAAFLRCGVAGSRGASRGSGAPAAVRSGWWPSRARDAGSVPSPAVVAA